MLQVLLFPSAKKTVAGPKKTKQDKEPDKREKKEDVSQW